MIGRMLTILLIMVFIVGCGKDEKEIIEDEYRNFQKQREIKEAGYDLDLFKEALRHYPKFKENIESGSFDLLKYRDLSREKNLDSIQFLEIFMVIKQIEDSIKTKTGNEFLKKKYNEKLISLVKQELGIK